jgi:xanthine dehydrogenase YagR molybdenum-binding subunit
MAKTSTAGKSVGAPLDRVDGRLKVTGAARYSAEMPADKPVYAVMVQSSIATGRIVSIDAKAAEAIPGVLKVMTHLNAPRLPSGGKLGAKPPAGRVLSLLQDNLVHYNGQPIAVVVAETLEAATAGALQVRTTYRAGRPEVDPRARLGSAHKAEGSLPGEQPQDSSRGDVPAGLAQAEVRVEQTYTTPAQCHNPMEPHATIAVWEGQKLTLYDSTQYVTGDAGFIARTLGLANGDVRVVCPFVGGGFGGKGSSWSHVPLAAMAAKEVGRPVKLLLTRRQMFGPVGGRPHTIQRLTLGARRDGSLTAIQHQSTSHTSRLEDWVEPAAVQTRMLYACDNLQTAHRLVALDLGTPTFQRAPGHATGTFALESAMDELAIALEMDLTELAERMINVDAENAVGAA